MEDELYPPHEYRSICSDNSNNLPTKIKEEVVFNNRKSNESIKQDYVSYKNHYSLPQHSTAINTADEDNKNINMYNEDKSFNDSMPSKTSKDSLIVNYNKQMEIGNSRRRQTFKCPYCPKIFCNSSAIAKHKLTHSDERKYVCDICGKAFKRQDHLNGHKHTHKVNKPHACHFCDRSYSDARSLKRHYENQHQKEYKEKMAARDSGSSVDDNGPSMIDPSGFFDDHKSVKCEVCGRGFKNQSALNGHMRLHGGYGQVKNSISGPGEPKPSVTLMENSTEKAMESVLSSITTEKQLSRGVSNIIIQSFPVLTPGPENNSDRSIHSLLSLIPSSSNTSDNFSSHCNSSTARVLNSHHFTNSPKFDQSPPSHVVTDCNNLPNVTIEDLCLVLPPTSIQDRMRDPCSISSTSEKSTSPIEMSTDGFSYSQSNTKLSSSNTDLPPHQYSPITPAYPNKPGNINLNIHDQNLFTYPSLLDSQQIVNQSFNEPELNFGNNQPDDYLMNFEKFHTGFGTSNTGSINKSWPFYDLSSINSQGTPEYTNSNPPSLNKISSSNNFQDILMNLDNLSDSNDVTINSCPSTNEENIWSHYPDPNSNNQLLNNFVKKEEITLTNIESVNRPLSILNEENGIEAVLKPLLPESQPTILHKKTKCRPAPIFIPPQTSAHMSRLRSPRVWNTSDSIEQKIPPYTPPPMLSPQRKGPGLFHTVRNSSLKSSANSFCSWNTPFSTNTITALSNNYCHESVASSFGNQQISTVLVDDYPNEKSYPVPFEKTIEPVHFIYQEEYIDFKTHSLEDKDGLPTSATPRINIGPEYQAELSKFYPDKRPKSNKRVYDTLLWNPRHFKETGENISSLNLLMKIASSPAVKSCGLNMEYTFHLLFKFQGDLEKTLQALLEESFVVYDYVYAETCNWTNEEISKFQERLKAHDRDFMQVSLDLRSFGIHKSVKACVEFYYVWKHMNNSKDVNLFRVKSRKRLATRNNTPQHEDDNYPPVIDSYPTTQPIEDVPYNLRRKYVSANQKITKPFHYYGSRTSSCSSSREPSPPFQKLLKNISVITHETAKKSRLPYHCSQCNRTFAKLKTLENHNRSHIHSKISTSKTQRRNIERVP